MTEPTPGHLVAGDVSTLAVLFDRWSSTVHAFVARALPASARPSEVDEIVEDVFWQMWQRAGRDTPTMRKLISESIDRSRGRT